MTCDCESDLLPQGGLKSTAAGLTASTLAPFIITQAVLLAGYVTIRTVRGAPPPTALGHRTVTVMAAAGIAAIAAVLWAVAVVHPSVTEDRSHVLSILLDVALTVYFASALRLPTAHAGPIRYSAVAGALFLAGGTAFAALTGADQVAISPMLPRVGIGVCLTVAIGVAVTTRDATAARHAGFLTAILAAPMQFAITTISLLILRTWSLTATHDPAVDPALVNTLISDTPGGHIITGILIGPLILGVIAALAATVGVRLERALALARTG